MSVIPDIPRQPESPTHPPAEEIRMSSRAYAEFLERLDAPPLATPALRKLAAIRPPWADERSSHPLK